jgi:(2Fe-2S) ferredoxin
MPYFAQHIFCCENRREAGHSRGCCAEKDASALRAYFKDKIKEKGLAGAGKIRVNSAGCLDRCELGPVIVIYPEDIWYSLKNTTDIDEIIESHLVGGTPVARLMLADNQKR